MIVHAIFRGTGPAIRYAAAQNGVAIAVPTPAARLASVTPDHVAGANGHDPDKVGYARRQCSDGVPMWFAKGAARLRVMTMLLALSVCLLAAPFQPAQAADRPLRIVAFGDSLTAGYGLPAPAAFPAQLQKALEAGGRKIVIENAGVSGDTTQAGLDRLDWSIGDGVDGVIVELGANDALRGLDPAQTRSALDQIIVRLKARKIPVMLAGMRAPPNMGADFQQRFDSIFPDLAREHGLILYPFFLDGVAGRRELNQNDGIHPTADGIRLIVERILPSVERFIASLARPG
jgi:acyl-CoA thioesterase-1